MFGTLSIQSKEPVTFMENSDLESVLSRNRQQKLHVSCTLCRSRKTKCSGEPSGCDKCLALNAECTYPPRQSRRKKRAHSVSLQGPSTDANRPNSTHPDQTSASASSQASHGQDSPIERPMDPLLWHSREHGHGHGHSLPGQHRVPRTSSSSVDMDLFSLDSNLDLEPSGEPLESWMNHGAPVSGRNHHGPGTRGDTDVQPSLWPECLTDLFDVGAGAGSFDDHGALHHGQNQESSGAPLQESLYPHNDQETDDGEAAVSPSSRSMSNSLSSQPVAMESVMASLSAALASPRPPSTSERSSCRSSDCGHGDLQGSLNNNNNNPAAAGASVPSGSQHNHWVYASSQASYSFGRDRRSTATSLEDKRKPPTTIRTTKQTSRRVCRAAKSSAANYGSLMTTADEGCKCLTCAAYILEDLGAKSISASPSSLDILLGLLRSSLAQCKEILACRCCHGQGETSILLVVISKYLSGLYEQVVRGCVLMLKATIRDRQPSPGPRRRSTSQSPSSDVIPGWPGGSLDSSYRSDRSMSHASSATGASTDDMWFSSYRIESSCERMHVLTTLVTVQITEFTQLLASMKARSAGRTNTMIILLEAEKVTNLARRTLRSSIDQAVATKEAH